MHPLFIVMGTNRCFAQFLLLLCLGAAWAWPHPDWPAIKGVDIDEFSLEDHWTHKYRLEYGFVVRRGFPFDMIVTVDKPLSIEDRIEMIDASGIGKFHTELVGKHGPHDDEAAILLEQGENARFRYRLRIHTASDAPIAKYDDIEFHVSGSSHGHPDRKTEEFRFSYPFPIYLIFNPLNPDDEVHFPDRSLLEEYIMNERGLIWSGSENDHEEQKWYYGQFDQIVLDSFFKLIADISPANRTSVLTVGHHLSRNQGYVTTMGPPFGNPHGILEGRWTGSFDDAYKSPTDWDSTVDILDAWENKFNNTPVKYGQCWVFAATQNSFMRAIGVATRQIECFDGRIDKSATFYPDKKMHHVVNFYYDKNGTEVKREGHVWNFHSWNDVWVRRDKHHYSGWQALDGTPKGLGAASVRAVYDLDEEYPTDTKTLISSVHATVQHFLVECHDPKKEHCDIKKRLRYKKDGVNLIVTKEPHRNEKQDITDIYVRPGVDVFDGAPHNPWSNATNEFAMETDASDLQVTLSPSSPRVTVGEPIVATEREGGAIDVSVVAELQTYMGEVVKTVSWKQFTAVAGTDGVFDVVVNVQEYAVPDMNGMFVSIRAVAHDAQTGDAAFDGVRLPMRGPRVTLLTPPAVAKATPNANGRETFDVTFSIANPYDFALDKVCVKLSGHNLLPLDEERTKCFQLDARESLTVVADFVRPEVEGDYSAGFIVSGAYLPTVREYMEVQVIDAHQGLRQF